MDGVRYETLVDQKETLQFKRWFGKSKVVNEDGTPRVVYHGTGNEFNAFDQARIGENYWQSRRGGFFFTSDKHSAENYAAIHDKNGKGGRVIEAYIKMERPLKMDAPNGLTPSDYYDMHSGEIVNELNRTVYDDDFINEINVYDGLIIQQDKTQNMLYMPLEPTQIKSATDNIGTFDPENPDVRYSLRETDENIQESLTAADTALEQVRGYRMSAAEASRLAAEISREMNSSVDQDELARRIADTFGYAATEGAEINRVDTELNDIGQSVMEKSSALDSAHEEAVKEIRSYLKNTPIHLTENQRGEAANQTGSMGAYYNATFGQMKLRASDGIALDQAWSELSEIAPQYFP
ncbi:MAG: hypothetical protein PHI98_17205, partial [Eubacteriales bacterium]|nr:hypothetical protein [Eubacteriales bacterium]